MANAQASPDVKSLVQSIRKAEHNFALLIGKTGLVFEADKRRAAPTLRKKARENGGGTKGAIGKARFESGMIILKCEEEPPKQLKQLLKKFFMENGVKNKFAFEVGGSGEATEAQTPKPPGKPAAKDKKPILVKVFAGLKPEILGLMKVANPQQKGQLQKLIKAFGTDMKKGDFDRSAKILKRLRDDVAAMKTRRVEGQQKRKAEMDDIRAQTQAVMARLKGLREQRRAV